MRQNHDESHIYYLLEIPDRTKSVTHLPTLFAHLFEVRIKETWKEHLLLEADAINCPRHSLSTVSDSHCTLPNTR